MKRSAWAAGLAGLVLLTTSCGGSSAADTAEVATGGESGAPVADEDADLVIWTDDLKITAIRQIADGFEDDNGITVDVQAITDTQGNFCLCNTSTHAGLEVSTDTW